jgi:hypothetical protein
MKDKIDAFWFLEQPSGYFSGTDLEQYDSGRLGCLNTHFDTGKGPRAVQPGTMSSMASPMG